MLREVDPDLRLKGSLLSDGGRGAGKRAREGGEVNDEIERREKNSAFGRSAGQNPSRRMGGVEGWPQARTVRMGAKTGRWRMRAVTNPADSCRCGCCSSVGLVLVPKYGTEKQVLFSIWETRRQDYAAYAAAVSGIDTSWKNANYEGQGRTGERRSLTRKSEIIRQTSAGNGVTGVSGGRNGEWRTANETRFSSAAASSSRSHRHLAVKWAGRGRPALPGGMLKNSLSAWRLIRRLRLEKKRLRESAGRPHRQKSAGNEQEPQQNKHHD